MTAPDQHPVPHPHSVMMKCPAKFTDPSLAASRIRVRNIQENVPLTSIVKSLWTGFRNTFDRFYKNKLCRLFMKHKKNRHAPA
jgi:hypothetical protein